MSKKILLLVILLLVGSLSTVSAQTDTVFCGDLAAADCDLLTQSQTAMASVESFGFDLNVDFNMSGVDMGPMGDSLAINLTSSGDLAFDMAALASLPSESPTTPEEMSQMMEKLPEMMSALFNSFKGQATFSLNLPQELMTPDMPELKLDVKMVNGVLYADIGPLSGMTEPSWMGLDIAGMYSEMFKMGIGEMGDAVQGMDLSQIYGSDFVQKLSNPEFLAKFMAVTRLDDAEVMGQPVAVFETSLDYGALLSDPEFQTAFQEYMDAAMAMQGITPEMMGDEYDQMMTMIMSMLSDFKLTVTEWIGLEDHYVHHGGLTMTLNMDLTELAKMDPSMATSDMPESVLMTLDATIDLHNFNEPVEVTVPEGAQVINPMMFMGNSF